jgi:glycosyltransferase involved in cell wall biosynthesis
MKNKIKVKPIFGAHQIYQEIVNNAPEGVEYQNVSSSTAQGKYYEKKKWKEKVNEMAQTIGIPRMMFVRKGNYDIIHTSRGIIPLQAGANKPWVMDVEQFTSFIGLHFDLMTKNKLLRWIVHNRLRSNNCKAILCHCEATRQSFLKYLNCKGFEHKLQILYPSSHLIEMPPRKGKSITFLSIMSLFKQKGGIQVLEAFSQLEKKNNDVKLIIRADVPREIQEKYNSPNIEYQDYFSQIVPREELIKTVYSQADVFIYTTFCDSFGYSLIDALVAKLPIISTNLFAAPEVVEEGKNGYIVNIPGYKKEEYVQEYHIENMTKEQEQGFIHKLYKAMEKLAMDKELREKMANESYDKISQGKFSIKQRNIKLKQVYEECLNDKRK